MYTLCRVLFFAAGLFLSGCTGDESESPASAEADPSEAVEEAPIELNRRDLKSLRYLADQLINVLDRMLGEKMPTVFQKRTKSDSTMGSIPGPNVPPPPFSVTVADLQLLHPFMEAMRIDQTFSTSREDRKQNRKKGWGAGITIELRNDTSRVLRPPAYNFGLLITTAYGEQICETHESNNNWYWRRNASKQPDTRRPWVAESVGIEAFWRPGEVLRRQLITTCGGRELLDTSISGATVVVDLVANEIVSDKAHEMDNAVDIAFEAGALTLRRVTLDERHGYAFGSGVVFFKKGRVVRGVLNDLGLRPDTPDRFSALPDTPKAVAMTADELSITMDEVNVDHWADDPTMKKGTRRVRVRVRQALNTNAVKARLKHGVTEAEAAQYSAEADLDAAKREVEAAGDDAAKVAAARRGVTQAQRALTTAGRATTAAKRTFDTGVDRERKRQSTALACERIKLVTPTKDIGVSNSRDVRDACAKLAKSDSASAVLHFTVSRYAVPLGLTYTVGRKAKVGWIASKATTSWDPR